MNENDEYYTVKELAALLKVATETIYRHAPKWPHHRIGSEIRFSTANIEAIKEITSKTPASTTETKRRPNVGTRANRIRIKGPTSQL